MGDNVESKIISLKEALNKANELNLDLVEISPNAEPPVCKLIDYKKFIYDQKKKQKAKRICDIRFIILFFVLIHKMKPFNIYNNTM